MTTADRRILIIGGGVAGAACAIACRKAGLRAELCEAYGHGADEVGAWLTVAANGIDALRTIDLAPARLGGFDTPRMMLHLHDGKLLAAFDMGRGPGGVVARSMKRAELYVTLRDEAVRRGTVIHYGKRLVDAVRRPDGSVCATFEDGTPISADVLVGADGIHSAVRQIIDPNAPRARYVGLLSTGGYATGVQVPGEPGTMQMFFGRRCFFAYVVTPWNQVWWFANPTQARELDASELRATSSGEWRRRLLELFRGEHFPAEELIHATAEIPPAWPTYDFPHVPVWHRDGMVIIGDAAHATSPAAGQGASMAIEDGVMLARMLRDVPALDQALAEYEQQRRARVERVVAVGKRNGDGKTPSRFLARLIRDVALRIMLRRQTGMEDPNSWITDHHIDWNASAALRVPSRSN